MHSAHITVECDHEDEDYCPATFTMDVADGRPLGQLDIQVVSQAMRRGWKISFADEQGRTRYVCPLHRSEADDAR